MAEGFRWGVYVVNLDPVIGSEQGRTRPVLVVSEESVNAVLPILNVLPITSRKSGRKVYPNEVLLPAGRHGLSQESIVLCHQIRTIDKRRLTARLGSLDSQELQSAAVDALSFQLGIPI